MGKIANPTRPQTAKIISFFQNGDYYFAKGLKAYRKHDLSKAKKYLYKAIQMEPQEPVFLCQLAIVLTELGEYQQSNKLLLSLIKEIDPKMFECHYFIANNFAHLGLFKEAKKHAEKYMRLEPNGEFTEENDDLLELLSIDIDDDDHDMNNQDDLIINQENARKYLEQGQFQDAILLLEQIIQQYPEFWSAYNNLALAHFYSGDTAKAMHILDDVLQKNQGNLHALCNKLIFHYYLKETEKVNELISQLENIHPILIEHRYKLGASFSLVGEFELAYRWLKQLYSQGFSGETAFYYWLSYAAYYTGRMNFSRKIWKRVLLESPEKAGSEPWNFNKEVDYTEIFNHLLNSSKKHERLFGLFLFSLQSEQDQLLIQQGERSEIEKDFSELILNKNATTPNYVKQGYQIAHLLFEQNQKLTENQALYLTWFHTFLKVIQTENKLDNIQAWAAAVEYVWCKQQNQKTSYQLIAERYHISSTTVKKYVKLVNLLLQ